MANTKSTAETAYIPGVCNINREEIAKRRSVGYFGLALFVVVLVVMLAAHISRVFHLVLFIPALLSATGFLQAKNHFCVGYASSGMENADKDSKAAKKVSDDKAISKDKQKARQMNLQALTIAAVIAVICLIIPK